MDATAADWITAGFTVVLAGFTAALVVVTARYVIQTKNLVTETQKSREEAEKGREQSAEGSRLTREEMRASRQEARESRLQSVRPRLVLSFIYRGPAMAFVQVKNVGQGPALDIDVELAFEPVEGGQLGRESRRWRTNLVDPGEDHWFSPASGQGGGLLDIHGFAAAFAAMTLTGTMDDALGTNHQIDERFEDLPGYRDLARRARHIWQQEEPARSLKVRVGDPITNALGELRWAIDRLPRRQEDEEASQ